MKVPSSVVLVAVIKPRNSVFQATPQRWPPARHDRLKLRSCAMRSHTTASENGPSSRKNAADSALSTGNTMNSASRLPQPTTAAATNRSPLKKPRRATPNDSSTSSADSTTNPPQPMPGWRAPSSPRLVFIHSNAQPRAPIAKPLSSRAASPSAPPATSRAPCLRPAGRQAPRPATTSPARPSHSQGRPNKAACISPLAACSLLKTWPTASRPLASCCAYQGNTRYPSTPMASQTHKGRLTEAPGARVRGVACAAAAAADTTTP